MCVEEPAQHDRPKEIAGGEGQDIPADVGGFNAIKYRQDNSIGEEDRVIEERLGGHQGQADKSAQREALEQRIEHFREMRVSSRAQADRGAFGDRRQINARIDEPLLD